MTNLGQNIRRERQARGWSLKKLSGMIGVSIMTLQRIETGKVSPSVDLLTEIAFQLGLSVTQFVSDKERILVHIKSKDLPLEKEGPRTWKAAFPSGLAGEDLTVGMSELQAGGVIDWASDKHFEGAHILDGQAEFEFDDRKVRLQKGETLYFDASFRRRIKSANGAKAVVVLKS